MGFALDISDMERHKVELRLALEKAKRRFEKAQMTDLFEDTVTKLLPSYADNLHPNVLQINRVSNEENQRLKNFLDNLIGNCQRGDQFDLLQETLRHCLKESRRRSFLIDPNTRLHPMCLFCANSLESEVSHQCNPQPVASPDCAGVTPPPAPPTAVCDVIPYTPPVTPAVQKEFPDTFDFGQARSSTPNSEQPVPGTPSTCEPQENNTEEGNLFCPSEQPINADKDDSIQEPFTNGQLDDNLQRAVTPPPPVDLEDKSAKFGPFRPFSSEISKPTIVKMGNSVNSPALERHSAAMGKAALERVVEKLTTKRLEDEGRQARIRLISPQPNAADLSHLSLNRRNSYRAPSPVTPPEADLPEIGRASDRAFLPQPSKTAQPPPRRLPNNKPKAPTARSVRLNERNKSRQTNQESSLVSNQQNSPSASSFQDSSSASKQGRVKTKKTPRRRI